MIRLRTFLLAVTSSIVVLTTIAFYLQAQGVLGTVFSSFEQVNRETVKNTSQSIVEARLYALRTYRATLENDNRLSSDWLVSHTEGGYRTLGKTTEKLRAKTQTDLLDITDGSGKSVAHGVLHLPGVEAVLKGESQEGLLENQGELYLISLSPLRNYGEPVAVLVLGYSLNKTVAAQVSQTTRTEVRFAPPTETAGTIEVRGSHGEPIQIGFSNTPGLLSDLALATRERFLLSGAISLFALFVLISIGLELGFIRPFRRLVGSVGAASSDLDREIVQTPELGRFRISEMDTLGNAFIKFTDSIRGFSTRLQEKSRREAQAEVAEQVAHDLKSPLSALDMMLKVDTLAAVPEKARNRLNACVERIREIVKQLTLQKKVEPLEESRSFWAYSLVDTIVAEKRVQYKNRDNIRLVWNPDARTTRLFLNVSGTMFRRALSNLIDNAIQAIPESGEIEVKLSGNEHQILVSVSDTGTGIAPQIRDRLFERGATYGKAQGSGLGLFSAREFAREAGGDIQIKEPVGPGTLVEMTLPRTATPAWFCERLDFSAAQIVAVLDDDSVIREMWKARLGDLVSNLQIFKTPKELREWWATVSPRQREQVLFLVDYELHGETLSGLDTIESLGVAAQSVLVTSHAEREDIQMRCERQGLRILPKDLIPLDLTPPSEVGR